MAMLGSTRTGISETAEGGLEHVVGNRLQSYVVTVVDEPNTRHVPATADLGGQGELTCRSDAHGGHGPDNIS